MNPWQEIGTNVYRRQYEHLDLNVGAVIGSGGVLVVDTRASHPQGREVLADLKMLTELPVRWVVNTHFHWDHCWGNAVFRSAELWAHVNCRHELEANGEKARAELLKRTSEDIVTIKKQLEAVDIVPPRSVFESSATIDLGDRSVELLHLGRGHTDSDVIVIVPDAAAIFVGDLVEEGAPPVFSDAYPLEWPQTLRAVLDHCTGAVVPGHGGKVDLNFVAGQLQELEAIAEIAHKCHAGEIALQEAVSAGPYPEETMRTALNRALSHLRRSPPPRVRSSR